MIRFKQLFPLFAGSFLAVASASALAGELVYRPLNPSFGGDPLRGGYLLNKAQAQDTRRDPNAPDFRSLNQTDLFIQELRSGVLNSALSQALQGDASPTTIRSATLDIMLIPSTTGAGFNLRITDKTTGEITDISFGQQF
ncbi:curli assembly protein CsgF [uncultured Halomonas sp.]|uniref:curli assembly protein CsgF n=1 Tax=uncultured Halomonas sp. TaxID=173971 RepID=UPI002622BDD8|nr:curli assembly protein CsgF [uncultured Halomonas sp.]